MRERKRSSFATGALVAALAVSGCQCGKKTDAQILRERLDTTSVHLYVATKIAVTRADSSPEVAEARKELFAAIEAVRKDQPVTAPEPPALDAHDFAALAVALWKLRAEGAQVVSSGREDGLEPVLPVVLRDSPLPRETMGLFDLSTEHALFLAAMLATRLDKDARARVPDELILYEASRIKAGHTKLEGFAPEIEALAAIAFDLNGLCDLGAAASARADDRTDDAGVGSASETLRRFSAAKASFSAEQVTALDLAARGVAHGLTGSCYLDRGQKREAVAEMERLVRAAEALGAAPRDTAPVHAAIEKGDLEGARVLAFGIVKEHLARTGVLAALSDGEIARALRGYLRAASGALDGAKRKLGL